jgi:hypothetical protein
LVYKKNYSIEIRTSQDIENSKLFLNNKRAQAAVTQVLPPTLHSFLPSTSKITKPRTKVMSNPPEGVKGCKKNVRRRLDFSDIVILEEPTIAPEMPEGPTLQDEVVSLSTNSPSLPEPSPIYIDLKDKEINEVDLESPKEVSKDTSTWLEDS